MSVLLPFLNQKTDVCLYKRVFSVVLGKDFRCTSMSFFRTIAITKSNSEVLHHSPHAGVARWTSWFFLQPLLDFSTYSSAIPVTSPQRSSGGAAKWPIVSLPRTFMQNRDTRCRVGGGSEGDGLTWTEGVAGGESTPFDQPASLSASILLYQPALFSFSSSLLRKSLIYIYSSTAEEFFSNKGRLQSFGCHW